jgi:hypothetical protein
MARSKHISAFLDLSDRWLQRLNLIIGLNMTPGLGLLRRVRTPTTAIAGLSCFAGRVRDS